MLKEAGAPAAQHNTRLLGWLLNWTELEAHPRAIADADRTVLWANEAAWSLLRTSPDLHLLDDALQPTDPQHSQRFADFVADAGPAMSAWCLGCADGDGGILFRVWRVTPPEEPPVVGLIFHTTGSAFRPQWAEVGPVFGLTAAEAQVLRSLLDGLIADRVAERLGISVDTVRSHIRRAYQKLGVSSREELFRRTAAYRLI